MKLSEQIKHCIDGNGCDKCENYVSRSKLTCPGLMYKSYEYVKKYEDMFPCKVGDKVYADSGVFGILEYEVDCIVIDKNITYQCSAYSNPIGDCPSECLDEIEPYNSDFGKTVFLTKSEAESAFQKMNEMEGKGKSHHCKLCGKYIEKDNLSVCDECASEYKF